MGTGNSGGARKQVAPVSLKRPTEDVGPLVRELMATYGLSREQLATEIGVTGVTVWYWLHGSMALPLYAERVRDTAKRLAAKLARQRKRNAKIKCL